MMSNELVVSGQNIRFDKQGYINITDLAKYKSSEPDQVIRNWIRNIGTLDFLAEWERMNNSDFNPVGFDGIRKLAGTPTFTLSVKKWKEITSAIGILAKAGRYGGTYAHNEIAFEFCSAISPAFKLRLITEWRTLKGISDAQQIRRELTKINMTPLKDAITQQIPAQLIGTKKAGIYYASEMDLLNKVVFGQTAREWKKANPKAKGNIRDNASQVELLILANLEIINTYLIKWDTDQVQRFELLKDITEHQRQVLPDSKAAQRLITKLKKK